MSEKRNIADRLLSSDSDNSSNDDIHSPLCHQSLQELSSDNSGNSSNANIHSPLYHQSLQELSTDNESDVVRVIPMHSRDKGIVKKYTNSNHSDILIEHPDDNDDDSNSIVSGNISNSVPPLSYLSFYAVIMASTNLHDKEHVKLMISQDWLTESL